METPKFFKGTLVKKILLAEDTYDLIVKTEEDVKFEAGQFLNLTIEDGQEPKIRRAYSICSPPHYKRELVICIKIVEGGRATGWMKNLPEGSEIEFMAPLGHFTFDKDSKRDALFIATGTGLAPLNSMIEEQLKNGDTRPMTLVFGLRHIKNMFYVEHLKKLEAKHPNFKYIQTLSRPENSSWKGEKGRVTDWLNNNFSKNFKVQEVDLYICGLGEMVQEVQKIMEAQGVPKEHVHFERYS